MNSVNQHASPPQPAASAPAVTRENLQRLPETPNLQYYLGHAQNHEKIALGVQTAPANYGQMLQTLERAFPTGGYK
ncbi:uncharacterized protein G6M90_00g001940 [Metarhizium brunneum]|uniref:Uncharacterized protein n=1 Tax=Metarhizium brunneum TaxID=500148 RepID=A0A7D5YWA3_9HYPO|nr:hypothetical protein G6M90_00g001940 [Metarhizium brunneum]